MATLRSPSGALYHTDDPRRINDLCLGQGYTRVDEQQPPPADTDTLPGLVVPVQDPPSAGEPQ